MSYILEALKRSQQERELGQVPRLEQGLFDVDPLPEPRTIPASLWALGLILVLSLVLGAVLYGPWTSSIEPQPATTDARTATSPPSEAAADEHPDAIAPTMPSVVAEPAPQSTPSSDPLVQNEPSASTASPGPASSPEVSAPSPTRPPPTPSPITESGPPSTTPPDAADDLTAKSDTPPAREPEVLVVPAPPRPGEPLPRGAEELRRAVLGPSATTSVGATEPPRPAPAADEPVPIPDDLLADIELFKRAVKGGDDERKDADTKDPKPAATQAQQPPASKATSASANGTKVQPASAELRGKLPPLSLNVHVYDTEPRRRFVYLNGRKLAEGDKDRYGIKVEQILPEGAVLSWHGERFLERR